MTHDAWHLALEEGRKLAAEARESAIRIREQLGGATLPEELRERVEGVCDGLVAFRDEVLDELNLAAADLDEPARGPAACTRRIYGLVDRVDLELAPLHRLLGALLNRSCEDSPEGDGVQVLIWYAGDLGLARGRFRGAVAGLPVDDEATPPLRHLFPATQYDWAHWVLTCAGCGWSGRGPEAVPRGVLAPGAERRCPRCERKFDDLWRPRRNR
jgi:hypothetical protein